MALGSFTSFTAGTTIVASQMNSNFANVTSWSSELARLDGAAFTGACTWTNTITVGSDGTGYDVKFFGDSTGHYMLWDQSADELVLTSDSKLSFHDAAGGENIVASADGHLEINAGTTLDITAPTVQANVTTLDVNGALDVSSTSQFSGAITVGVDDTGHDVKFFGASASHYMLWDQAYDALVLTLDSGIYFYDRGGERIVAAGDGHLTMDAGTTLDFTAPTIDLNASTEVNIDGDVDLNGDLDFTGTLNTTSANSIPRIAYSHGGASTVASNQVNTIPTIFVCTSEPTATSNGDIWFDIS